MRRLSSRGTDDNIWKIGMFCWHKGPALLAALSERDALKAENERLREALERIADEQTERDAIECQSIAQEALEPRP